MKYIIITCLILCSCTSHISKKLPPVEDASKKLPPLEDNYHRIFDKNSDRYEDVRCLRNPKKTNSTHQGCIFCWAGDDLMSDSRDPIIMDFEDDYGKPKNNPNPFSRMPPKTKRILIPKKQQE